MNLLAENDLWRCRLNAKPEPARQTWPGFLLYHLFLRRISVHDVARIAGCAVILAIIWELGRG